VVAASPPAPVLGRNEGLVEHRDVLAWGKGALGENHTKEYSGLVLMLRQLVKARAVHSSPFL
jgi:hypothetical protein